jgi:subtilisin family serine protease
MSTDDQDHRMPNSGFGDTSVDLAAPEAEWSLRLGGTSGSFGGNSAAVPIVSGAAALVWGHPAFHNASATTVKKLLIDHVVKPSGCGPQCQLPCVTGGVLDLEFLASEDVPDCRPEQR